VTHPELGREILIRLEAAVEDLASVETMPRLDGRQMTMVLAPLRRQRTKEDVGSTETGEASADQEEAPSDVEPEEE